MSIQDQVTAARASVPDVTPEEAARLIADGATVIDVREAAELAQGKVRGAVNVPRGLLEFQADPESPMYDSALDPDKTVLVYCAAGGRAALAGKALQDLGYTDVRNLGGFGDWAAAGGDVEQVES